jgi:hypothetical protein
VVALPSGLTAGRFVMDANGALDRSEGKQRRYLCFFVTYGTTDPSVVRDV